MDYTASSGWENYHLHAFKLHGRRHATMWAGERHRDAAGREVMLADLQLRVRQRILYEMIPASRHNTDPGRPSDAIHRLTRGEEKALGRVAEAEIIVQSKR